MTDFKWGEDDEIDLILKSMRRTLEVCAWDYWNEALQEADDPAATSTSGAELFDIADTCEDEDFQRECSETANRTLISLMRAWRVTPTELGEILAENGVDSPRMLDMWGHYLMMESLGHGVAWSDSYDPIRDTRVKEGAIAPEFKLPDLYTEGPQWPGPWPEPEQDDA